MTTLDDYIDSMLVSINDVKRQLKKLSGEVSEEDNASLCKLCKRARELDASLGMFRDLFFSEDEEEL